MRIAVVLALTLGCGRIGYDARDVVLGDDAPTDGSAAGCPADTTPITADANVCVEKVERGTATWTMARATCEGLGRRLCADLEWAAACDKASDLVNMASDSDALQWEWVADETAGVALKRGYDACDAMSSHEIFVDPYDYRCCVDI